MVLRNGILGTEILLSLVVLILDHVHRHLPSLPPLSSLEPLSALGGGARRHSRDDVEVFLRRLAVARNFSKSGLKTKSSKKLVCVSSFCSLHRLHKYKCCSVSSKHTRMLNSRIATTSVAANRLREPRGFHLPSFSSLWLPLLAAYLYHLSYYHFCIKVCLTCNLFGREWDAWVPLWIGVR